MTYNIVRILLGLSHILYQSSEPELQDRCKRRPPAAPENVQKPEADVCFCVSKVLTDSYPILRQNIVPVGVPLNKIQPYVETNFGLPAM